MSYEEIIKKQTKIIVTSVIVLVLVVIGASYALFLDVKEAESTNTITASSTAIATTAALSEGDDAWVNVPLEDDIAMTSVSGYNLSVYNSGETKENYYVALYANSDNTLDFSHIKVSISSGGTYENNFEDSTWSEPKLLSDFVTDSTNTARKIILSNQILSVDDGNDENGDYIGYHNIKIWIDDDTPTDEIGKIISLSIYICAEAV